MAGWKHYLLSWFPMLLLIGTWIYVARNYNACKASNSKVSDKLAQEQLSVEREKLAEVRRVTGLLERVLGEQGARISALESRFRSSSLPS